MRIITARPGRHRWVWPVLVCCFALLPVVARPFGATARNPAAADQARKFDVASHDARVTNALGQAIGAVLASSRADDETASWTPVDDVLPWYRSTEGFATRLEWEAMPPAAYEPDVPAGGNAPTRCGTTGDGLAWAPAGTTLAQY
jgi:hypothetical protein